MVGFLLARDIRPSTKERHCFLSVAILSISLLVYPIFFVSLSVCLCQVFRGLPHRLFPGGFHVMARRVIVSGGFLSSKFSTIHIWWRLVLCNTHWMLCNMHRGSSNTHRMSGNAYWMFYSTHRLTCFTQPLLRRQIRRSSEIQDRARSMVFEVLHTVATARRSWLTKHKSKLVYV